MRTTIILILSLSVSLILSSCFQKSFTPKEYFQWAKTPESGLEVNRKGNGVNFSLKFTPVDLLISNELKNGIITESQYDERKMQLGNLAYFLLKIESGEQDLLMCNVGDEQQYVQRVNYYSLDFQQDIVAVSAGDTIPCVLYQFENSYGIAPYVNISLAFPGEFMEANKEGEVEILIYDRIFLNGLMKFKYTENAFHDLPELTIE